MLPYIFDDDVDAVGEAVGRGAGEDARVVEACVVDRDAVLQLRVPSGLRRPALKSRMVGLRYEKQYSFIRVGRKFVRIFLNIYNAKTFI